MPRQTSREKLNKNHCGKKNCRDSGAAVGQQGGGALKSGGAGAGTGASGNVGGVFAAFEMLGHERPRGSLCIRLIMSYSCLFEKECSGERGGIWYRISVCVSIWDSLHRGADCLCLYRILLCLNVIFYFRLTWLRLESVCVAVFVQQRKRLVGWLIG